MKCKVCGGCCKNMFIWIGKDCDKDYLRWIRLHGIKVKKIDGYYAMQLKIKCQKLKNNRCSIYKNRPKLCREYSCHDSEMKKINKIFTD